MESVPNTCLNCDAPLSGKFCAHCGQRADIQRITLKEVWEHFLSSAFSFQGPLVLTTKQLFTNPGKLFRAYFAGKRKQFYNPVSYFIISTAAYIVLRSILKYNTLESSQENLNNLETESAEHLLIEASQFMVNNINNILVLLVLAIGFMFKLFFPKKYNLAEYLTAGFYLSSMYILTGIVSMLLSTFILPQLNIIQGIFLFIILFGGMVSLLQSLNYQSILKTFLASMLSILTYAIIGFGLSFLIVWVS